jgi:ubiquinone biosynthesis monooxygenase Coq7
MSKIDGLIIHFDKVLRTLSGAAIGRRQSPAKTVQDAPLDAAERRHSAGLMRVNHVGEVCAQALYQSQGQFSRSAKIRQELAWAAREEEDHLAWTAERLAELDARPSLLNPLWYAGSFILGAGAALAGDRKSLGFVVETERQVEAHLASHLDKLPPNDLKSRAIVAQMRHDEEVHGKSAESLGAEELPAPVRTVMSAMAGVMTRTAYYL